MRTIVSVAAVIILNSALALAQVSIVQIRLQSLGMVGIASGQTARLNALNPGALAPFATATRCGGTLAFFDDQGRELKTSQVAVDPGKSLWLDLTADSVLTSPTNRVEIRGVVAVPAMGRTGFCTLIPTLEIIDNSTGRTTLLLTLANILGFPTPVVNPGAPTPATPGQAPTSPGNPLGAPSPMPAPGFPGNPAEVIPPAPQPPAGGVIGGTP